jgi:RND family efflux transporter MFP subunit
MKIRLRFWPLPLVLLVTPLAAMAERPLADDAFDCVIEPNARTKVGSAEEGILSELLVSRGDVVKKGDPLARLDMELERLTAELARLRAEADVEVRSGKAQLNFRERETSRIRELQAKKAVAVTEFDKATVETELAQLSVEAASTEWQIAQVEYERASERLKRRTIRSPIDGVVVDVGMSPGEYVHEQATLMIVAAIDPLHVEVFVPVAHYGRVAKGMVAKVTPEQPVGGTYDAEVTVVDQVFDAASRTFGVRLLLPNRDYRMPAGLRCTVSFRGAAAGGE